MRSLDRLNWLKFELKNIFPEKNDDDDDLDLGVELARLQQLLRWSRKEWGAREEGVRDSLVGETLWYLCYLDLTRLLFHLCWMFRPARGTRLGQGRYQSKQ